MNEKIDQAIEVLAGKIVTSIQPSDALKYTQAALNMVHVKTMLLANEPKPPSRKRESGA